MQSNYMNKSQFLTKVVNRDIPKVIGFNIGLSVYAAHLIHVLYFEWDNVVS